MRDRKAGHGNLLRRGLVVFLTLLLLLSSVESYMQTRAEGENENPLHLEEESESGSDALQKEESKESGGRFSVIRTIRAQSRPGKIWTLQKARSFLSPIQKQAIITGM